MAEVQRKLTVLVVDDDDALRFLLSKMLRRNGFATVELSGASQALAALEAGMKAEAIVTDVNMPGSIDGIALAAAVHKRWPNMAILITSLVEPPPGSALPPHADFIPKRFDAAHEAQFVRSLNRLLKLP